MPPLSEGADEDRRLRASPPSQTELSQLAPEKSGRTWFGALLALSGIGLSLLYLSNPTVGVFEFIPDNLPIIGNLDEAAATALLIASLSRFGINLTPNFARDKGGERR